MLRCYPEPRTFPQRMISPQHLTHIKRKRSRAATPSAASVATSWGMARSRLANRCPDRRGRVSDLRTLDHTFGEEALQLSHNIV